ncbi:TadE/TadG family type IV pilus assembly protein [Actinoplanes sp. NPDC049316]|uniref:TadE/TadG family type IV pilus assembly protein n=1 Tax=Actinoplanes sp. NPDC049316 TaxID=3154727 RepID=UPI00341FFAA0
MSREGRGRPTLPATPAPGDQGAAAVELALVLPLLLLVLFGVIDFGRALNAQITLTEAAREGARATALGLDGRARVQAAAGPVTVDSLQISVCVDDLGADAVVRVSHAFRPVTPVGSLMSFFGGRSDGSFTIVARGVMPCVG